MSATVNSGLEGVVAAETSISLVDGQAGRLLGADTAAGLREIGVGEAEIGRLARGGVTVPA